MTNTKKVNIFIVENIPSPNKGEMTILGGIIETFKNLGKIDVSMVSSIPDIDQKSYGDFINIIDVKKSFFLIGNPKNYNEFTKILMSIFVLVQYLTFFILYQIIGVFVLKLMKAEIWKSYINADVIIVGHDGTIGNGQGLGIHNYFSILLVPLTKFFLNKPVVVYGGSFYSLENSSKLVRYLYQKILNNIDMITVRGEISFKNLQQMQLKRNNIFLTGDPAFLLPPTSSSVIRQLVIRENIPLDSHNIVGMTITREVANNAFSNATKNSSYEQHNRLIAALVDHITKKYNATVVFYPHCIGYGTNLDDRIVAHDIQNQCKNKSQVLTIDNEYSAAELKGLISQCNFFIGERVHSVINALSSIVPSILLVTAKDQRREIIQMLGQDRIICYIDNILIQTLIEQIDDSYKNIDQTKNELNNQIPLIKDKALTNGILLNNLLNNI